MFNFSINIQMHLSIILPCDNLKDFYEEFFIDR